MFLSGYRGLFFTDYSPPQAFEGAFAVPTVHLAPGATLYVLAVRYYFHAIIFPENNDDRNIFVIHTNPASAPFPATATLRLKDKDWVTEGFRDGDIIATCLLTNTCQTNPPVAVCRVSEIRGSQATLTILDGSIPTPFLAATFAFFGYVFLVRPGQHDPRQRKEQLIAKVARFGDVESEISPLSGLRWTEPHADAIFTGTNNIQVGTETLVRPSYIVCTSPFYDVWTNVVLPQINNLLGTTPFAPLAPIERFRVILYSFTHSHIYYYRTQYNTLARAAQRDFFHENCEYIARLEISSPDREITFRHRAKLLQANIDPRDGGAGAELTPLRPTLSETPTQYIISNVPAIPGWTFVGHYFALLGPDEHHKLQRIPAAANLTNFTFTGALNSINKASFLANLNRNPFETYVFGGCIYRRVEPSDNTEYYAAVLTDVLPVDIDFGIDQIVQYVNTPPNSNPERQNLVLSRWDTLHIRWSEPITQFEFGDWQVFITIRDPNDVTKPAILVQSYTMKVAEDNIVTSSATQRTYYTLHYAFKYVLGPPLITTFNQFLTANYDVSLQTAASNYIVDFLVPAPGFSQPQVRNPNIRPASGSLYDWGVAYGATQTTLRPGVQAVDLEVRVVLISPNGRVYATPWERFRAKNPEQANVTQVLNSETTFVALKAGLNVKLAVRLFESNGMAALRPVAEAVFGPTFQTTSAVINITPFFGSFFINIDKTLLPAGFYTLHVLTNDDDAADPPSWERGYQGRGSDWTFNFRVGRPEGGGTPLPKKECCYIVPVIQNEQWQYLQYNAPQNGYIQFALNVTNTAGLAQLRTAYNCCFEFKQNTVLRDGYVDVLAVFDNRYNNIPINGFHFFRYRGFIERASDELESESYVTQLRIEEPILKNFRKVYRLTLFMSDCELAQLDFQKYAKRWRITNYTNSILPQSIEAIIDNIDLRNEYNKIIATITLKEPAYNEFRHKRP